MHQSTLPNCDVIGWTILQNEWISIVLLCATITGTWKETKWSWLKGTDYIGHEKTFHNYNFFYQELFFGRCNLWMTPKKTRYGATSSDWKMHFCALPDVIFNSQVGGPNYFSKFQPWYNFMCKFITSTSVEGDDASFIISIFELHNLNWALTLSGSNTLRFWSFSRHIWRMVNFPTKLTVWDTIKDISITW